MGCILIYYEMLPYARKKQDKFSLSHYCLLTANKERASTHITIPIMVPNNAHHTSSAPCAFQLAVGVANTQWSEAK